jgi:tetratricopeptide (TPR) repeat protein
LVWCIKQQRKICRGFGLLFSIQKNRKILGLEKQQSYASTLNNIGSVYDSQGKYAEALDYYFKAQKIEEDLGLGKTASYASTLNNIGAVYDDTR